jgi:hypothetical protein
MAISEQMAAEDLAYATAQLAETIAKAERGVTAMEKRARKAQAALDDAEDEDDQDDETEAEDNAEDESPAKRRARKTRDLNEDYQDTQLNPGPDHGEPHRSVGKDDDEEPDSRRASPRQKQPGPLNDWNKPYPPTAAGGDVSALARCKSCGKRAAKCKCAGLGGGDSMKGKLRKCIDKTAASDAAVIKCLLSVSKGAALEHSQRSYEVALDALASAVQKKFGFSYAESYSKVLDSPIGATLFSGYCDSKPATVYTGPAVDPYISKSAPKAPLTSDPAVLDNVLAALNNGQQVGKRAIEKALDQLALSSVSKSGGSFYDNYSRVLDSEVGKRLYREYDRICRESD